MLGIMHMVAHQTLSDSSIESNPKPNINTPRAKIGQLPG